MNKKKLRAVMIAHGDTSESLSDFLGISLGTLSKKMNEKSAAGFTQPEIMMMKERYNLSAEDINDIFFDIEVS